ncbi:MAG TPA: ATPase, partial [Polyangiales bacterium]
ARFLQLPVRADRASWLAWAGANGVHPSVVALARAHERIFDSAPPRSFTYAGQLLASMTVAERNDGALVRDVLSGYLPSVWVSALANGSLEHATLDLDVHALLTDYKPGQLRAWKERGESDKLDELGARLKGLLAGPECGVLIAKKALNLRALEALLADLPGDLREALQEALGNNPTAVQLIDVAPEDVLTNYAGSAAFKRVEEWKAQPLKQHRIALLVTALRARVAQPSTAVELRKSNAARVSLGHLLLQLGERWGLPLAEALHKAGVTPVRPGA